jgi:hypothetical protein
MASYHWIHDLARIVLQDIIRRNRENGRRRRLKDTARGIKARPGRPPKYRISKLLFDPESGPIPIAPSPTPPPATPSPDDPSIDTTSSQPPISGLVQVSCLPDIARPAIDATNSVHIPTVSIPPISTIHSKNTAARISKQTTKTVTAPQSQLGRSDPADQTNSLSKIWLSPHGLLFNCALFFLYLHYTRLGCFPTPLIIHLPHLLDYL